MKIPRTLVEVLDLREKIAGEMAVCRAEMLRMVDDITEGRGKRWGREYSVITRVAHLTPPQGIRLFTFRHAELDGSPTTSWSSDWFTSHDDPRLRREFRLEGDGPLADLTWDGTWEEQCGLKHSAKAEAFAHCDYRMGVLRRRIHAAEQVVARTFFNTENASRRSWITVREVTVGPHKFWVLANGDLSFKDAIAKVEIDPNTTAVSVTDFRDRMRRKKRNAS
jgi:hypothetical protein